MKDASCETICRLDIDIGVLKPDLFL